MKISKKLKVALTLAALPFLLVWAGFILTGFAFKPHDIFQSGAFWGGSVIYWTLYICMIGVIIEEIKQ
jgi:hypothetical protein